MITPIYFSEETRSFDNTPNAGEAILATVGTSVGNAIDNGIASTEVGGFKSGIKDWGKGLYHGGMSYIPFTRQWQEKRADRAWANTALGRLGIQRGWVNSGLRGVRRGLREAAMAGHGIGTKFNAFVNGALSDEKDEKATSTSNTPATPASPNSKSPITSKTNNTFGAQKPVANQNPNPNSTGNNAFGAQVAPQAIPQATPNGKPTLVSTGTSGSVPSIKLVTGAPTGGGRSLTVSQNPRRTPKPNQANVQPPKTGQSTQTSTSNNIQTPKSPVVNTFINNSIKAGGIGGSNNNMSAWGKK